MLHVWPIIMFGGEPSSDGKKSYNFCKRNSKNMCNEHTSLVFFKDVSQIFGFQTIIVHIHTVTR